MVAMKPSGKSDRYENNAQVTNESIESMGKFLAQYYTNYSVVAFDYSSGKHISTAISKARCK